MGGEGKGYGRGMWRDGEGKGREGKEKGGRGRDWAAPLDLPPDPVLTLDPPMSWPPMCRLCPWDNRGKFYMDRKRIQCWSNA